MEARMTRFSSVQKLQAKTERGKCILSHIVRSKFIVKSCFRHALLNTYVSCSKNASEIREGARCKHDNFYFQVFVYLSLSHFWEENDCSTGKKENLTLSTF